MTRDTIPACLILAVALVAAGLIDPMLGGSLTGVAAAVAVRRC